MEAWESPPKLAQRAGSAANSEGSRYRWMMLSLQLLFVFLMVINGGYETGLLCLHAGSWSGAEIACEKF